MRSVPQLFSQFWTWFTRPASPAPLAIFRISISMFCLAKLLLLQPWFLDIYGQYGFVQWAVSRANLYGHLPHLGDVAQWAQHLGLTADQVVFICEGIQVSALLGLLVGYHARFMAMLAWCINYLWMTAGAGLSYGTDIFTHIALFYCMIMPVGHAFSIDARRKASLGGKSVAAGVTRRILQLHLSIIYASSGLEKSAGEQWWNGEAIWRATMLPSFRQFDMSWMAWNPVIPMIIGWSVIAAEIGYGVFMWWPKTRKLWLSLIIAMHLGIGLFLGMWMFGLILILLNLGAFGYYMSNDREGDPSRFAQSR